MSAWRSGSCGQAAKEQPGQSGQEETTTVTPHLQTLTHSSSTPLPAPSPYCPHYHRGCCSVHHQTLTLQPQQTATLVLAVIAQERNPNYCAWAILSLVVGTFVMKVRAGCCMGM